MKIEIETALEAHSAWRKRFRDFLSGKSGMDVSTVGATDRCAFGAWLAREGRHQLRPERYTEICTAHDAFHRVADGIVTDIREKDFAQAQAAIARDGELDLATARLRALLLNAL